MKIFQTANQVHVANNFRDAVNKLREISAELVKKNEMRIISLERDDSYLTIGLGDSRLSTLNYGHIEGISYESVGQISDPKCRVFLYDNQEVEVPFDRLIASELALGAAEHYIMSGERSKKVKWELA